ncbi:hypothetical protein [Streptomyces sp. NPDC017890]|uniref:hypothetical protein n=1 Tax=Streptomyces sp. NPDC017890 TaxID=3365015 RepID=UPI0037AA8613
MTWATGAQTRIPPDVLNHVHAHDVAGSLAMMPVGQALAAPAASAARVLLVPGARSFADRAAALLIRAARGPVRVHTVRPAPAAPRPCPSGPARTSAG